MKLRVLSYNIRYGGTGREKQIAGVIRACEPDVVLLQEADQPGVVSRIADDCSMHIWGAAAGHSLAFISRIPVTHYALKHVNFAKRRYLEVVLEAPPLYLFGVHLSAIHSNVTERRRVWELRSLLDDLAVHKQTMHLVTGDFNTLAPGEILEEEKLPARLRALMWLTGGRVRWKTIQLMLDKGYVDGYRLFHQDEGWTFPTWQPHIRLDYSFVPSAFRARIEDCRVVRDAPGLKEASDHFPLLTELGDG